MKSRSPQSKTTDFKLPALTAAGANNAPSKPRPILAAGIPVLCAHSGQAHTADLVPNPRNPKRHPRRQLEVYAKVIRESGWRRPIVVSRRSGLIVKGHGAYEAARDVLQVDVVPVDFQDYPSDEAELADLLADNKLAELAESDDAALADLLGDLTGKIDLELAGILATIEESGAATAAALKVLDVPAAPAMTWVLVGIPTVRFGEINKHVERIARVDGVLLETTFQSADEPTAEEGEEKADGDENR